uniref:Uncharacterized protein n=1 Tax=Lepeophtheirus salmonis TaxID=72036 RepID=A0A0K2TEC1_LEPSM
MEKETHHGDSVIRSPPETPPSSSTFPAYLSMYPKGSGFDNIAAPARNTESEKLRKIRRRKELKEFRKYNKIHEYKTQGDDNSYNFDAVLESLGEQNGTLNNNNSNNNNNSGNSTSNNGNKDNRKDKRVRRPVTRRRSNNSGVSNNSVKTNNTNGASSSSEENVLKDFDKDEDEDELEDDKMSSSSLVGGGGGSVRDSEDTLFSKPSKIERGLSKSSENLSHYSSENLSSFTKVTNKKQKWKKKNAHSVEIPDNFNINNNNNNNSVTVNIINNNNIINTSSTSMSTSSANIGGKGGNLSSRYNGYNLRNREIEATRPDLDYNARDFPPLDTPIEDGAGSVVPTNGISPTWSKPGPSSSVSSSSSSVINERTEEEEPPSAAPQKVSVDLPDVSHCQPPPINSNAPNNHHLPDLTAQAVEAVTSSSGSITPQETKVELFASTILKSGDIAIALTEEEYRSQDPSIPVVIFGRGSSAIRDWTSKSENFEFGFEINETLLAMSSSDSSHQKQTPVQNRSPPEKENENIPLDRIDRAILSFGDSVTNLTVLGDESTADSSPQLDNSIHLPPYVEEPITFNYNEVINYLENAWLDSLKDTQQQQQKRHPVASSAY